MFLQERFIPLEVYLEAANWAQRPLQNGDVFLQEHSRTCPPDPPGAC